MQTSQPALHALTNSEREASIPDKFLLTQHSRLTLAFKSPCAHSVYSPSVPSPPPIASDCSSASSFPPNSLRVLQWNAGGFRTWSTKVLHFFLFHPVELICIQYYNVNSFSSFRIPGFSALRSDRIYFRSGILSRDAMHASGGVIIFVRQALFLSEFSTFFPTLLDPYSDYVGSTYH